MAEEKFKFLKMLTFQVYTSQKLKNLETSRKLAPQNVWKVKKKIKVLAFAALILGK